MSIKTEETPIQDLMDDVEACFEVGRVPALIGPPGVGKTAIGAAIARKRGGDFAVLIGSQSEPTDFTGFAVINHDKFVEDSTGKKHLVLDFAPRRKIVELDKSGGVLAHDELTSSGKSVQAVMLRGLNEREYGEFTLSDRVDQMAMMNPADIAVNGTELDMPMIDRLCFFTFPYKNPATRFEWCANFPAYWGTPPKIGSRGKYLPDEVTARARAWVAGYLRANPNQWLDLPKPESGHLAQDNPSFPTPRSWDFVSRHLALTIHRGQQPFECLRRIEGEIGSGSATTFLVYLREKALPDPENLLLHPEAYEPSGRVDLDFATTLSVAAAFEAKPTMQRFLACWKVLRRAIEKRANTAPSYEAGFAASRRLVPYFKADKATPMYEGAGLKASDCTKLLGEAQQIALPFLKVTQKLGL